MSNIVDIDILQDNLLNGYLNTDSLKFPAYLHHGLIKTEEVYCRFSPYLSPSPIWLNLIRSNSLFLFSSLKFIIQINIIPILLEAAWCYALHEKYAVEINYIKPRRNDYPPCVVVAISKKNYRYISFEKAGYDYRQPFHPILKTQFVNVFRTDSNVIPPNPINCSNTECKKYSKFQNGIECRNRIGNCAEQRAANWLFQNIFCNATTISDIDFSLALRPRTMSVIPYCCNCNTIFPQLR